MVMTPNEFLKRLQSGKAVNCIYRNDDLVGLINAWLYEGTFILTWEECKYGGQNDEETCSRDERRKFQTAEEVLAFVEKSGYGADAFRPL